MCACEPDYVCLAHRGTRRDPRFLLTNLPDGDDPLNDSPEQGHVSEWEVRDGA